MQSAVTVDRTDYHSLSASHRPTFGQLEGRPYGDPGACNFDRKFQLPLCLCPQLTHLGGRLRSSTSNGAAGDYGEASVLSEEG